MQIQKMFPITAIAAAMSFAPAQATDITGGGSTFIYPVLSQWAQQYATATGTKVNYQAIGSGGGLRALEEKTVTFAASDMPLKEAKLKSEGYVQWPQIAGAIVPVVNIDGVAANDLVLDGKTMAEIYLGKITDWSDPAIKALNPDFTGAGYITVVHRSDGSGTTFNFTNYLDKVSPDWDKQVGSSTEVNWPTGIGGKGNAGVAQYVQSVPNSIGYVEYAYALENNLAYTKMVNQAGKTVEANADSFKAAAEGAAQGYANAPGFYLILTDQPGDGSWPILATTFILTYATPQDAAETKAALDFFDWSFKNGTADAQKLDYLPIPETVFDQVEATWTAQIMDNGTPVWSASN